MRYKDDSKRFHEQNLLDRTIETTLKKAGELSLADLNRVTVAAQVQAGIDHYRAEAMGMSVSELYNEKHDSSRLARHLEEAGQPRPPRCHAHAIVAGRHQHAAVLRALMANLKIRIDDTDNGCWLPENQAATPHPTFPRAIPHSRIHRYNYYFWIRSRLEPIRDPKRFRLDLRLIAKQLQENTCPEYVMMKKGEGLPDKPARSVAK
ncbi:AHH domain-containing protein [Microbulbifer thermotolerans]|uniref:AHH domain-containing protein n=1 Tax=Microbulbifer thermotolerans TaxID=252514 RepID=UPI002672413B|nr:AHH domain-containing protein [Microbulbifer thermotolerans]WKT60942.1 AHH domain-containing protein [Microbulbifer thermotolerans]